MSADVQAALSVVGASDPAHDGPAVVDLETTNLASADLSGASFAHVNLEGADLDGADLDDSILFQTNLAAGRNLHAVSIRSPQQFRLPGADCC